MGNIESLLHAYFVQLIECERHAAVHDIVDSVVLASVGEEEGSDVPFDMESIPCSLDESLKVLGKLMEPSSISTQRIKKTTRSSSWSNLISDAPIGGCERRVSSSSAIQASFFSSQPESMVNQPRSVTDSLLFRLIVTLQLCLIRINDVRQVMGLKDHDANHGLGQNTAANIFPGLMTTSSICLGATVVIASRPVLRSNRQSTMQTWAQLSFGAISVGLLYQWWMRLWMVGKLSNSTSILEDWKQQWMQSNAASPMSSSETKTQALIDVVRNQSPKMSFWQSEGELRFLVLKRAMDLLYASVGTALEVNKPNKPSKEGPSWQVSLTAMAAASYLSVIGPNKRAAQAVNEASSELIQNAWGMVSLPAIKLLSLRATRLLKGAALAERIVMDGVPCFILSKDPCPDVIIAMKRYARQEGRRSLSKRLSTIDEIDNCCRHRSNSYTLRKRNVIFHLTGGGFFAHTLASDLPYLLDWSKTTGAIVICPEYSLLPENSFPVALDEVARVYKSLFDGDASIQLGFDVNRIVMTGESAGGNLAAAMCVKLGMSLLCDRKAFTDGDATHKPHDTMDPIQVPNALMLSCPALNLSLELSPSRVIGDKDPVLPSGLISAISDAYAPSSKYDPLVSPLYAPDECLRYFPSTLIFCSSDDPLLDDSVHFNARLKRVGVESDLRATHHMPHAYWGLGTAGFPEARQVQAECAEFLREKLGC